MKIRYKLLSDSAVAPLKMSLHSAGYDLSADLDAAIEMAPGARLAVPTGLAIELPIGFEAQIRPRSGLALNNGIGIVNSPGTIDADYRGEIKVILVNLSNESFRIEPGMRICQMVISKLPEIELEESPDLGATERADGGFGSTGH